MSVPPSTKCVPKECRKVGGVKVLLSLLAVKKSFLLLLSLEIGIQPVSARKYSLTEAFLLVSA